MLDEKCYKIEHIFKLKRLNLNKATFFNFISTAAVAAIVASELIVRLIISLSALHFFICAFIFSSLFLSISFSLSLSIFHPLHFFSLLQCSALQYRCCKQSNYHSASVYRQQSLCKFSLLSQCTCLPFWWGEVKWNELNCASGSSSI